MERERPVLQYEEPRANVRWWWRFVYGPAATYNCIQAAAGAVILLILASIILVFAAFS